MPPRKSERNSAKKASKVVEEPEPRANGGAGGTLAAKLQSLFQGCVLAEAAPKIMPLVQELKTEVMDILAKNKGDAPQTSEAKSEDKSAEKEGDEKEVVPDFEIKQGPTAQFFGKLRERLLGLNFLGIFRTGDATVEAFLTMKKMEFDGGPRAKRKGTPTLDRLAANFHDLMPVYIYLLLAMMSLRSLFFRSLFACLPWLMLYQFLSVWMPLEKTEKIPLPMEKVPLSARVAIVLLLHSLVWLFFVYELLVRAWWLEWFLITAGFTGIAYVLRPMDA